MSTKLGCSILCGLSLGAVALADPDPHLIADPLMAEATSITSGFAAPAAAPAVAQNSISGSWGPVIAWTPHIPVTAATLPDGRLLTFASNQRTTFPSGPEFTYAAVWDPKTGVFTEVNNPRHDMFCGGTAMLPDGRVVINGGRATTVLSSIFDFRTSQWNALQNMNDPRWYNPSVALPDGTVFTVSGSGGSNTAELWNASTGWRRLTGIGWSQVTSQPGYINIWHPFLMLAPNGKLFHFGPTDVMNWVTVGGSGTLNPSGQNVPGTHYPKEGAWAMYDEGRILIAGGGATTTNNPSDTSTGISTNVAYTVNLNGTNPVVASTASMQFTRQFANSVMLPNGEVMVVGGNSSGLKFNDTGSIMTPEVWNPTSGSWRSMADMSIPRNYHSVALLLPDGRVWSGGGGLGGGDHRDAQIFTPPSLFASDGSLATRPAISEGPSTVGVGTTFTVRATPGIRKFSFIRMAAQTHAVCTDLRYLSLPFTETSPGLYQITGSANSNVMLPGYWMLFGLNPNGVHSEARIIKVALNSDFIVSNPGDQQSVQGDPVQLQITASALPSITLTYSAMGLPDGLSIDPGSGLISGTITGSGSYWATISARPSTGGVVSTSFNWNVLLPNLGNGKILREWWLGLTGSNLVNLTSSPLYPANPSGRDLLNSFEAPINFEENFGQRIRGYLHPAVTGQYRFHVAGDDESSLLLSTDSSPANAVQIASVATWTSPQEWTKFPSQTSALITLQAGKRYYIEALMKEGGGGDHLSVGWTPPGSSTIAVIPGQNLSPFQPSTSPAAAWQLDETVWRGSDGEVSELLRAIPGIDGKALNGASTSSTTPALSGNPGTGRCGTFSGASQFVQIPFHSSLNPGDLTLAAWVRPDALTAGDWRAIAVSRTTSGSTIQGYGLYLTTDGKWAFYTGGSTWTQLLGPTASPAQWTHVAVTFRTNSLSGSVRTGTRRIFINGIQVAEDTGTYTPVSNAPLRIGASELNGSTGHFMIGSIDEVRLYPTPLGPLDLSETMALRHRLNYSPVPVTPGSLTSTLGSVISQPIQANDPDGDAITYAASGLPDGLGISSSSGIISGSPTRLGSFNPTVTVTDSKGDSSSLTFAWSIVENLSVTPVSSLPQASGANIAFQATGTGGINPRYKWNFGDGSPESAFSSSPNASHLFSQPGRYLVTVTATDDTGRIVTRSFRQAVHAPLTSRRPVASSPISYESRSSGNDRLWVVNPDNDSVSVIDTVTRQRLAEIAVGTSPRCVAIAPDGRLWITNAVSATLSIVDPASLAVVNTLALPSGSRPFGLAFNPDGSAAYVSLEDKGQLLKLDPLNGSVLATLETGPHVRHLSIPGDGKRVYLSRFITPRLPGEQGQTISTQGAGGEVLVISTTTHQLERTLLLAHSEQPDTAISSRGIPNYLGAATLSPDGLSAWVPSKQDNVKRGRLRDNQDLTHDMSVRSIASRIDLTAQAEDLAARVDFDNAGMPSAVSFDPWGIYAFVALEASRSVAVIDVWNHQEILRFETGRAPQGLTVSPDGRRLFVHNFMDRSVSVHDLADLIQGGNATPAAPQVISSIASEKLAPQVLTGKQLFYDARDNRLAFQEYLSCATCHNDGGEDGRVWDFTGFGEGLRNTITLRGHGGTRQGPLHWTANFDEVQDFENQIRNFALGQGLISNGSPHPPLDQPNAGRSGDLDALAAYLQSLTSSGKSPYRGPGGALSASAVEGEKVFRTLDCASCHGGAEFTHSAAGNLRDIGTIKPTSGKRLGSNLTGFDIPTLRGVWNTAPYLHDGSAATLEQAVTAHQGLQIAPADLANLVDYVRSIDDLAPSAPLPRTEFAGWAEITPGADGQPLSNADGDLAPDLLEFALGGLPNDGASPASNALSLEELNGNIALVVQRPAGLKGLTYEALTSPDLISWTPAPPAIAGTGTLRFENLQTQPGISPDAGFVRLRVTAANGSATTLPLGWQAALIGSASRTLGVPFRESPLFSSQVISQAAGVLAVIGTPPIQPGFKGYIEVIAGPWSGHRFQVGSASGNFITLAESVINTVSPIPDLGGCRIVLCAHHTLGGVFPKPLFKGSTNPSAADQLQFYVNTGGSGQFQLYYLLDARPGNPTHQWRAFLPGGGDQGGRVIAPGEGVLLKRPTGAAAIRLLMKGQVRANPFVQPLQRGVNLVSSPFPTPLSPRQRGLLDPAAGFLASTNLNAADQFQLYQSGAFRVFYLLDHPTLADQWREAVAGSPNHNDNPLIEPTSAIFLKRTQATQNYVIPRSWNP